MTNWPPKGVKPYYLDDSVCIVHGNAMELMPSLTTGDADLCVTDFPYANNTDYSTYDDTVPALTELIQVLMPEILRTCSVALITPGVANVHHYPPPRWILCWAELAGTGSGPWGFCSWQPVLAYGTDPYLSNGLGRRPDTFITSSSTHKQNGHPCPKPLHVMRWLVVRGAPHQSDVILDPLMGSGTTLRAAKDLGRRAIGIEIEERYCEIAAKRMSQSVMALEV